MRETASWGRRLESLEVGCNLVSKRILDELHASDIRRSVNHAETDAWRCDLCLACPIHEDTM